jgi:putative transposase
VDQTALRLRIREIAYARPRYGASRICTLLRREGWHVNRKRVHRLYRIEGLQVRMRVKRRKHMALHRGPAPIPTGRGQRWSMDFVHDALLSGRAFRALTVVDQWSRESPLRGVAFSFTGREVVSAFEAVVAPPQLPKSITVDHGT